jgi:hypothetical protein
MTKTRTPARRVGENIISSDPTRTPGHVVKVEANIITVRWCYGLEAEFRGSEFENFCEGIRS